MAELADISYRAFNGERQPPRGFAEGIVSLGQIPLEENRPVDAITKEMIQEYQEEQLRPKYKDVFGNDVSHLPMTEDYNLETFVPIVLNFLGRPATERDKQEIQQRLDLVGGDLANARAELDELFQDQNSIRQILRTEPGWVNRATYYLQLKEVEGAIKQYEKTVKVATKEVEKLNREMELIDKNIEENLVKASQVKTINRERVKAVASSLMLANRENGLRVEQGLDETDAQYLRRLRQIPNERFDTNLYQDK